MSEIEEPCEDAPCCGCCGPFGDGSDDGGPSDEEIKEGIFAMSADEFDEVWR